MRSAGPVTLILIFSLLANVSVFAQTGKRLQLPLSVKERPEANAAPVKFNSAEALSDGQGNWIKWTMDVETANFGFNIYRIDGKGRHRVGPAYIPGSAARMGNQAFFNTAYSHFDAAGSADSVYVIESQDMNGRVYSSNPFGVTRIEDLAKYTGISSAQMVAAKNAATGVVEADRLGGSPVAEKKLSAKQLVKAMATQQSLVSQASIKIGIKKMGMYRITRAQLEAVGFDVNTDSSLWQLYAGGIQQAMLVGPSGSYIDFFGKGFDEIETDTRYYYLIVGASPGSRMGARNVNLIPSVPSANFQYSAVRKYRSNYINTILNGETTNFFGPGVGSTGVTTATFNLTGLDTSNRRNNFTVEFKGFSFTEHSVNITLNGTSLPPVTGSFQDVFRRTYTVSPNLLRDGVNTIEMMCPTAGDSVLLTNITVDYRHKYLAQQNQLNYLNENFREVTVRGFASSNVRIFDLADDSSPILLQNLTAQDDGNGTFSVFVPQYRSRVMHAVEDSGLLQPASIVNKPASDLTNPANGANLVILSHKTMLTQAEDWANYRRGQGFTAKVVDIENIYDEFNFGTKDHSKITEFLNYAKTSWATPPSYVLIIGDASYDPRNFEGNGDFDFVPSKIVNTIYTETPSDDALVDFNGDGYADIPVGRIVARTGAQVTTQLNRVIAFEVPAMQNLNRGALYAYDEPNGYDFQAMSGRISAQLPGGTPLSFVGRPDLNAPATLLAEINSGKYVANYSGHGTVGAWAVVSFFGNPTVSQLRNENLTIFTMLTCLNGYFINPTSPVSLAENLMASQWTDGSNVTRQTGAIAVWASTGLTTPDVQEIMATRFYDKIGDGTVPRLGDLAKDAKSVVIGGNDVLYSWVLFGDPMLKVR